MTEMEHGLYRSVKRLEDRVAELEAVLEARGLKDRKDRELECKQAGFGWGVAWVEDEESLAWFPMWIGDPDD